MNPISLSTLFFSTAFVFSAGFGREPVLLFHILSFSSPFLMWEIILFYLYDDNGIVILLVSLDVGVMWFNVSILQFSLPDLMMSRHQKRGIVLFSLFIFAPLLVTKGRHEFVPKDIKEEAEKYAKVSNSSSGNSHKSSLQHGLLSYFCPDRNPWRRRMTLMRTTCKQCCKPLFYPFTDCVLFQTAWQLSTLLQTRKCFLCFVMD